MPRNTLSISTIGVIVLLISVFTMTPTGVNGQSDNDDNPQTEGLKSEISEVYYNITFFKSNSTAEIDGHNTGRSVNATFVVSVDGVKVAEEFNVLDQGGRWRQTVNISEDIHAFRESHKVTVSTWGDSATFEFERDIDASTTTSVPVPYVTNVSLTSTDYLGDQYAAVNVTLHNPSVQAYLVRAMVDTTKTNGAKRDVGLRNHTTTSVIVPLKQSPGEVRGEVRIYGGNASEHEDALAQVEFHGTTSGSTTFEEEPYVPVPEPAFAEDGRQYRYRPDDGGSLAEEVTGDTRLVAGAGLALVLGITWWRRR